VAEDNKPPYEVGFGKPPRSTQFKPGQSGNPAGRPRGAKNFATAIEQELDCRITVTEDGKRKRISKREVIAKHLVNKAAGGDLKAIPLLFNELRVRQSNAVDPDVDQVHTPEDEKVFDSIIARLRENTLPEHPSSPSAEDADACVQIPQARETKE
jgi:hypothetical protein